MNDTVLKATVLSVLRYPRYDLQSEDDLLRVLSLQHGLSMPRNAIRRVLKELEREHRVPW